MEKITPVLSHQPKLTVDNPKNPSQKTIDFILNYSKAVRFEESKLMGKPMNWMSN